MLSGDAGRSCIAVSISFLKKTVVVVRRRPRLSITFPADALSGLQKTICRQLMSLISRCKTCLAAPFGCRNCVGYLRLAGSNCRRVGETSGTRRPNHKQSTSNRQRPNDARLQFRWVASPGSGPTIAELSCRIQLFTMELIPHGWHKLRTASSAARVCGSSSRPVSLRQACSTVV